MKKQTSLRIPEEYLKELDNIAKKEGINRTILINRAIRNYLKYPQYKKTSESGSESEIINELGKKYGEILTRLNIVVRQVDQLMRQKNELNLLRNEINQLIERSKLDKHAKRKK